MMDYHAPARRSVPVPVSKTLMRLNHTLIQTADMLNSILLRRLQHLHSCKFLKVSQINITCCGRCNWWTRNAVWKCHKASISFRSNGRIFAKWNRILRLVIFTFLSPFLLKGEKNDSVWHNRHSVGNFLRIADRNNIGPNRFSLGRLVVVSVAPYPTTRTHCPFDWSRSFPRYFHSLTKLFFSYIWSRKCRLSYPTYW